MLRRDAPESSGRPDRDLGDPNVRDRRLGKLDGQRRGGGLRSLRRRGVSRDDRRNDLQRQRTYLRLDPHRRGRRLRFRREPLHPSVDERLDVSLLGHHAAHRVRDGSRGRRNRVWNGSCNGERERQRRGGERRVLGRRGEESDRYECAVQLQLGHDAGSRWSAYDPRQGARPEQQQRKHERRRHRLELAVRHELRELAEHGDAEPGRNLRRLLRRDAERGERRRRHRSFRRARLGISPTSR